MAADVTRALASWQDALARARDDFASWKQDTEAALDAFRSGDDPGGAGLDEAVLEAESKLSAITGRLEQAHRALMAAYDSAVVDQAPDTVQRLEWQRAEQTRSRHSLRNQIDDDAQATLISGQASVARALFEAASKEWNQPRPCRACGTPIVVGAVWRPTTFTCECGEKTTVDAAPLTARFYGDHSLESICSEHALDAWRGLRAAMRRYRSLAHPVDEDFAPLHTAAHTWAKAHADLYGELHPAWQAEQVSAATDRRTADALGDANSDTAQAARASFTQGATMAAGGDQAALMRWAQTEAQAAGTDMGELVAQLAVSVHEHGDRNIAWQVIALQHHVHRVAQDRDGWMRDRLAALDAAVRLR